jgi:hypothetical protein
MGRAERDLLYAGVAGAVHRACFPARTRNLRPGTKLCATTVDTDMLRVSKKGPNRSRQAAFTWRRNPKEDGPSWVPPHSKS